MRQFKAEGLRDDLFAGTTDTFFIKYLLAKAAASCKDFGLRIVDISVEFVHARRDEKIYVKVPPGTNGFVKIWTWNSTATIFWCVD